MHQFTDGGLADVWLANGYVERDTPYGRAVSFQNLDGLIIAVCTALVAKPGKLTGAEFRYIRSALQLSQKSLGNLVGYSEQAVAKWEKSGKVPKAVDAVLRMLFNSAHGQAEAGTVASMLDSIDRDRRLKLVLTQSGSTWSSTFHDVEDVVAA